MHTQLFDVVIRPPDRSFTFMTPTHVQKIGSLSLTTWKIRSFQFKANLSLQILLYDLSLCNFIDRKSNRAVTKKITNFWYRFWKWILKHSTCKHSIFNIFTKDQKNINPHLLYFNGMSLFNINDTIGYSIDWQKKLQKHIYRRHDRFIFYFSTPWTSNWVFSKTKKISSDYTVEVLPDTFM